MNMKQMQRIKIIWGAFLITLVVMLTFIGFLYKNKSGAYKQLEKELEESAKKYVDARFLYPDEKDFVKISFEEMKSSGFIEELKKDEDVCDGYVIVKHNGSIFEYKGFVSCPKFTTKGYEK
ncbi:MAG: hypothetical protein HFH86_03560 [Bacilli bacterium]|jgi:hypothetical protein|nr:hypothetical protein [Bacilli bacterium]